ncbi:uncharacterized protein Z520_10870 [Fonsecaea multimorphosa CBS 102226]|uniref:Uncharacterized protein n=1 Tax=Fonsecaea multimorphosa CBS 102226 TaxID=1442371 RepID=A0A0D2I8E9_9EURO|nr:uncharacterized protein Z520_10870 [Fonsecaea multimorphosa CBS 102226]KIX93451.1 hypothetical protein Z520_10870 [Fonsecaea multimorphosa CBS 102226]OAL18748.1 hypothetical protein AYO22_10441 [Fonsecaea multimorphosa]
MPETVNCAQPQEVGPARFVDRIKARARKRTAAVRGCLTSVVESESEDPAARIEDFLTYAAGTEFRGSKRRQPEARCSDALKQIERQPEDREVLVDIPHGRGSVSSFSTVLGMYPPESSSTISLPSTFSMGSMFVPEPIAQQASPAHPSTYFAIETPDDFERFRSDLRNRTELESVPALPTAGSRLKTECFHVDSTPIPVGEERDRPRFKAYPGKPDADNQGPVSFQAYSAGTKLKHGSVRYIPPTLQSGYVNGVPPALRAAHTGNSSTRPQSTPKGTAAGHTSQNYSWPLVDFHKEIFLNADPSQTSHSTRYQEPRIPSMEFTGRGLEDEMKAVLDSIHKREIEKEAAHVQDRAWMSPGSPLDWPAYEREACIPAAAAQAGVHPRVLTIGRLQEQESSIGSVPAPLPPSSEERRVKFSEYNWPRFSDDQFTDPAEEHSREYRRRRREARRNTTRREL